MNWVRINATLPSNPKMIALARLLKGSLNEALGVALRWLCWLDSHTTTGQSKLTPAEVNEHVCQHKTAAEALTAIGWAELGADGTLNSVDYTLYNSPSAKTRAVASAKKANQRRKAQDNG